MMMRLGVLFFPAAFLANGNEQLHRPLQEIPASLSAVFADGFSDSNQWNVVFQDDFSTSDSLEVDKWRYVDKGDGFGNQELQWYTDGSHSTSIVSDSTGGEDNTDNSFLRITPKRELYNGKDYTSAKIESQRSFLYGRFEIEARLPRGKGMWSALWMLPKHHNYGIWPNSGELDIMENVGYDECVIHGTIHTATYNHMLGTQNGKAVTVENPHTQFHKYTLDWFPDVLHWYIDGVKYHTIYRYGDTDTTSEWPFNRRFYLIMNVAVGGSWGGAMGIDDAFFDGSHSMDIRSVKVWQPKDYAEGSLEYDGENHSRLPYPILDPHCGDNIAKGWDHTGELIFPTCKDRSDYLINELDYTRLDAEKSIKAAHPLECYCLAPEWVADEDCLSTVAMKPWDWDRLEPGADPATCGSRINWLQYDTSEWGPQLNEWSAERLVRSEFPAMCGCLREYPVEADASGLYPPEDSDFPPSPPPGNSDPSDPPVVTTEAPPAVTTEAPTTTTSSSTSTGTTSTSTTTTTTTEAPIQSLYPPTECPNPPLSLLSTYNPDFNLYYSTSYKLRGNILRTDAILPSNGLPDLCPHCMSRCYFQTGGQCRGVNLSGSGYCVMFSEITGVDLLESDSEESYQSMSLDPVDHPVDEYFVATSCPNLREQDRLDDESATPYLYSTTHKLTGTTFRTDYRLPSQGKTDFCIHCFARCRLQTGGQCKGANLSWDGYCAMFSEVTGVEEVPQHSGGNIPDQSMLIESGRP